MVETRIRRSRGAAAWNLGFVTLIVVGVIAACGPGPTPAPTSAPVASPTPAGAPASDRHLFGTRETNEVYQLLVGAGLVVRQEGIGGPGPGGEPPVTLFVLIGPEHVAIHQYTTAAAVAMAGFIPGSTPAVGDAPFEFWAANIVIAIGPANAKLLPGPPDASDDAAAFSIVDALDPYIGPFEQRAVSPLILPSTPAPPSPSAHPTPTPKPARTPRPSPSPKRP